MAFCLRSMGRLYRGRVFRLQWLLPISLHTEPMSSQSSNWFDRHFGIEIEMILPQQNLIHNHIDLHHHLHDLDIFKQWQIKKDNTIYIEEDNNDLFGFEIISPKLLYTTHTKHQIEQICNILTNDPLNAYLNVSCGFHVHCDAIDINLQQMHKIAMNYTLFESVIDEYMNTSRRANNNIQCKSLTFLNENTTAMNNIQCKPISMKQMDKYLNPDGRCYKLNFCALKKHLKLNTIENRHHSGTIDAIEILNWTKFNLLFIHNSTMSTIDLNFDGNEDMLWKFIDDIELMTYYKNKPTVDDCGMLQQQQQMLPSVERFSFKQKVIALWHNILGRS